MSDEARITPRLYLLIAGMFALRLVALALVDGLHPSLAIDYCQWDCGWYLDVVRNGYERTPYAIPAQPAIYGQANWAFFPLYPLLVQTASHILPVSDIAADLFTANLFLFLFVIMAVRYLSYRRPGTHKLALAAFLLAFPYSLYFSLPYTESLFAFFATSTLFSLSAQRLTVAAGFSALSSATRVPGILFTPIIVVRALKPSFVAWQAGDRGLAIRHGINAIFPIALAPLGLALFMVYLYAHMGDGLAFVHIQTGWGRHSSFSLHTLFDNLNAADWQLAFAKDAQSRAVNEYAAIAGLILSVRLFWLRLWPEGWLLAGTIMLALSAGLVSMQRFVFANPVFLMFLFDWFWQSTWMRRCFVPLLAIFAGLQLYFAYCWLGGYGFLM